MNWILLPEEEASVSTLNIDKRQISLFAAGRVALDRLVRLSDELGMTVVARSDLIQANADSVADFWAEHIFVDISGLEIEPTDTLVQTMIRLDAVATERGIPVIANAGRDNLDLLAACFSAPSVTLMCDATASDWTVALSLAQMNDAKMRDVRSDESTRLQRLADEVDRIAKALAMLADNQPARFAGFEDAGNTFRAQPRADVHGGEAVDAADVRSIVKLRRLRDRYFDAGLFADPAWDMLLDLMAAKLEHRPIAVSSLCIAAAVPPTTALRWIKTMTENGMFVRVADPQDGRRVFIELSEGASTAMTRYLGAAKVQGGLAI